MISFYSPNISQQLHKGVFSDQICSGSGDIRKSTNDYSSYRWFCEGLNSILYPMKDIFPEQDDGWVHTLLDINSTKG